MASDEARLFAAAALEKKLSIVVGGRFDVDLTRAALAGPVAGPRGGRLIDTLRLGSFFAASLASAAMLKV
jgi:hypothetical protein